MVSVLNSLTFSKSAQPSHEDQESAAERIASIIDAAQRIGHEHAAGGAHERAIAWGGRFQDAMSSAWAIVTNFIQRIKDWVSGQDADALTEDDIEEEVDSLAGRVASVEVHAAIEEEVWQTLYLAGVSMVRSIAQPGACQLCLDKAAQGAMPINDFTPPPYHGSCRCNTASADEE